MSDIKSEAPLSRAAGRALMAGGAIYFVAEFIAAAAWTDPPYSYTYHWISDLGVHGPSTAFGQFMYSPLAWVMNTGFVLFGPAVLAGVLMLRGLPVRRRWALVVTAALLAVGSVLVGLFPGSAEALDDGTGAYHGLGAFTAFVGGNVLAILLGRAHRLLGVPRRVGRVLVGLGTLGFVSLVAFVADLGSGADVLIGLVERGVIYPYLIGFIVLGAALRTTREGISSTTDRGARRR
ncbi:DUF998 domain-containing protein [Paractinoplanes toevensis]|uniref:DUF998 domain-containing protein n=1 Tax=Paractinoplanes toevensis TaxID=571911 RepID=A0A919TBB4_9ACTN|nr:DUF998 domain-containing protein [Actinoplanes toevensis]GIM92263.1 hypothetical protein Ato02nite_040560 [Actinoplanes toevensis]